MEGIRKTAIRNPLNFKLTKEDCETPKGESITVPDESMSIQSILQKFTTGLDQGIYREGQFHGGDFDSPDLEKLRDADLFEKEQFRRGLATKMVEDERLIKEADAKEKKRLAEEDAEMQELRRQLRAKKASKENANEGSEKGEPAK